MSLEIEKPRVNGGISFNQQQNTPVADLDSAEISIDFGKFQLGENGTLEFSDDAITDPIVALFNKTIQGMNAGTFTQMFSTVLSDIKRVKPQMATTKFTNLVKLCFLTRSCRGGKGLKELFYLHFECMSNILPETTENLCKLIAHYGYWKDCFVLISRNKISKEIMVKLLDIVVDQFNLDCAKSPSLLAKWIPRKGKALYLAVTTALHSKGLNQLASEFMRRVCVDFKRELTGTTDEKFRKIVSAQTKKIGQDSESESAGGVVENYMCAGTWSDINFDKVTSKALDVYKNAFAMKPVSANPKDRKWCTISFEKRYQGEMLDDREACKENYKAHLLQGTNVKGAQVALDKMIEQMLKARHDHFGTVEDMISQDQLDMAQLHRQFESYVDSIDQQLLVAEAEVKADNASFQFSIDDTELMVDVSSSMKGTPMNAAIGIALVFLKLQKKRDPSNPMSFLTFDTNPTVITLKDCLSVPDMVKTTAIAPWGGSTDFIKAFDEIMKKSGRNIRNAPKQLLVLSDMQFNEAFGHQYTNYHGSRSSKITVDPWTTMYQTICLTWRAWYGLNPVDASHDPVIVFWNLRSDTTGSPVDSTTKGVIQISGYSASLVKMLLFGQALVTEDKDKPSPADVLNRTLHAKEYDLVATALGWTDNGTLNPNCTFAKEVNTFIKEHIIDVDTEKIVSVMTQRVNTSSEYESDSDEGW